MGYDLYGPDDRTFRLNMAGYGDAIELALTAGWEPAGTLAPDAWLEAYGEWPGGYFTNDHQLVSDEDARALADALEAALDDIPDEALKVLTLGEVWATADLPPEMRGIPVVNPDANLFERWSGPRKKDFLREFIAFCRQGGFRIG